MESKAEEKSVGAEEKVEKVEQKSISVKETVEKAEQKLNGSEEEKMDMEEKSNGTKEDSKLITKSDGKLLTESDATPLEADIIRQIEYYFGDLNLPRDKFLQEQISLDDGWVPFDIMLKFKRLASISSDLQEIINALKKSDSGLTEISEDGKKIRRSAEYPLPELNEERRLELLTRTLYVKGFPKNSTVETILEYFKDYPSNEGFKLRNFKDKASGKWLFKGSVFVTFKKRSDAECFMELKSVKHGDTELIRKWQKDYYEEKKKEFASRKSERWKKEKNSEEDNDSLEESKYDIVLPTGTVLHVTELTNKITKESIKDAIALLGGDVAFVDYQMGDKEGWIRLKLENSAKEVHKNCKDGKLLIGDDEFPCKLLEGEEEKEFLKRMTRQLVKRRKEQRDFKNKKFKGGNKGGKYNQGRKRKGDRNEEETKKKKLHK